MTDIIIAPTGFSIGEYDLELDIIRFWHWTDQEILNFYRNSKTETNFEMVIRVVCHEEMHKIIWYLEGDTTYDYDFITQCDIRDLP